MQLPMSESVSSRELMAIAITTAPLINEEFPMAEASWDAGKEFALKVKKNPGQIVMALGQVQNLDPAFKQLWEYKMENMSEAEVASAVISVKKLQQQAKTWRTSAS